MSLVEHPYFEPTMAVQKAAEELQGNLIKGEDPEESLEKIMEVAWTLRLAQLRLLHAEKQAVKELVESVKRERWEADVLSDEEYLEATRHLGRRCRRALRILYGEPRIEKRTLAVKLYGRETPQYRQYLSGIVERLDSRDLIAQTKLPLGWVLYALSPRGMVVAGRLFESRGIITPALST